MEVEDVGEGSSCVQDAPPALAAVGPANLSLTPAMVPVQLAPQQWAMPMVPVEPPPLQLAVGDLHPLFGKFVKRQFLIASDLARSVARWGAGCSGGYAYLPN